MNFFGKKRAARPQTPIESSAIPWLLACVLVTAAPHVEHLPLWLSLVGAGACLARFWLWHRHGALPKRWLLSLFVIVGVFAIVREHRTLFGRDAGVALLFFFMALKPMEIRTRRDALVLIMLGYFLLLTHYLFSETIPTGLWLLFSATLLTATLIRLYGGHQPVPALLRQAGVLLLQAAPFMLILFVLFPRIQGPLWGLPQDAHAGRTGLSNSMSPGSLSSLIQSGEIAFRVLFDDAPPAKRHLYWRGPVFVDYDGKTWHARPYVAYAAHTANPARPEAAIETHGQIVRYTSTLEPSNQRWLLALDMPVELPDDARLSRYLETSVRRPIDQRRRVSLASAIDFTANREERQVALREALRLPANINPQARVLATSWKEQLESPERISDAALQMFRNEAFFYTLQPPLLGTNAIDDFLFTSRRGFCEHFAAAYVFLMRAAGVPARVVAGYQGGELNPLDGYLVVRQSDAHAWAEIWIAGKGWVRVDPTFAVAPSRIESGIANALPENEALPGLARRLDIDWLLRLRYRWEAFNNAWDEWVLGYNTLRQQELLSRLGFRQPDWQSMMTALTVLCGVVLLAVTLWALRRRRPLSPAQRLWQRYCRRLQALGIECTSWEGPLTLAERTARQLPQLAELTRRAAGCYAELRYGPDGEAQPEHLENLKHCLRQIERWRAHDTSARSERS